MLVDGKWVPTFENACYLYGETEFEHWRGEGEGDHWAVTRRFIMPAFDAGLVDLVQQDQRRVPRYDWCQHRDTRGACQRDDRIQGRERIDYRRLLHHPCQFAHPEWSSSPDVDRPQAIATRRNGEKFAARRRWSSEPISPRRQPGIGQRRRHLSARRLIDGPVCDTAIGRTDEVTLLALAAAHRRSGRNYLEAQAEATLEAAMTKAFGLSIPPVVRHEERTPHGPSLATTPTED